MRETFLAFVGIIILGLCTWLFDVDFQIMLLIDIAFDLKVIKMKMEDEK